MSILDTYNTDPEFRVGFNAYFGAARLAAMNNTGYYISDIDRRRGYDGQLHIEWTLKSNPTQNGLTFGIIGSDE